MSNRSTIVTTIDSTQALQPQLDAINRAGGGTLELLPGTYVVTSALTVYSDIKIIGSGQTTTTIVFAGPANFTLTGTSVYDTGTISSIATGTTVTGSGTTWDATMIGQQIFINNRWYVISNVAGATTLTLASAYADGATYSGTYRISTVIHDVTFQDMTITGSTGTAIEGTDVRDLVLDAVTLAGNAKGFTLTNIMDITVNQVIPVTNTSSGFEITNGSFFNAYGLASISNGGHGGVLSTIKTSSITFSASDANTGDGYNLTSVTNCLFTVESSGNGGQGIEFVTGCNDNIIGEGCFFVGNTSDGVKLTAASDRNRISGGNFQYNGGYGINIAASTCDTNYVVFPIYVSNTAGTLNDSGTGTVIPPTVDT